MTSSLIDAKKFFRDQIEVHANEISDIDQGRTRQQTKVSLDGPWEDTTERVREHHERSLTYYKQQLAAVERRIELGEE